MPNTISTCCRARMTVQGSDEGTSYYGCSACHKPCDVTLTLIPSEEEKTSDETYTPRVGDRILLKGVIRGQEDPGWEVEFTGANDTTYISADELKHAKLLSRPRTLTKEEAERLLSEKLEERVTIEGV